MTKDEKVELLDWIGDQSKLCIQTRIYGGGREEVAVWTIFGDEDEPSGRAPTVLEALAMAKKVEEHEATH